MQLDCSLKIVLPGAGSQFQNRGRHLTANERFQLVPECCPEFFLGKRDLSGTSDGAKLSLFVQINFPVVPIGAGGI